MSNTTRENIANYSGGSVHFTLTAPVAGDDYDKLVALVAEIVYNSLIPAVNTLCDAAGADDKPCFAQHKKEYATFKGRLALRVKVDSTRPVNFGKLNAILEHAFAETHRLVDLVCDPSSNNPKPDIGDESLFSALIDFIPFMRGAGESASAPFSAMLSDLLLDNTDKEAHIGMSPSRMESIKTMLKDVGIESIDLSDIPGFLRRPTSGSNSHRGFGSRA